MSGPYFQKQSYPSFSYRGTTYDLSHLDEYLLPIQERDGTPRAIAVTFGDHCFTRDWQAGDTADLIYPGCSRNPGYFSFERYECSLATSRHIATAIDGKVWLLKGHHFAIIPTVTLAGTGVYYGIVFNLDRVSGIEGVDLHMRVKTAYPFTRKQPTTYGSTRFRVLIELRMKNKYPGLNTSQHRRW